ncbi:MAG: hypothetical protein AAF493_11470 [Pseudomonadota bacterium]
MLTHTALLIASDSFAMDRLHVQKITLIQVLVGLVEANEVGMGFDL